MKPSKYYQNASDQMDVINILLEDHKPLKALIKIMKDDDKPLATRKSAFEEFAPKLVAHAKPEERALYTYMKKENDLREEGFEGDVEHGLADQLVEEAKRTADADLLGARIKVLAELVEHHLEEEEETIFPHVRRRTDLNERSELADEYLMFQEEIESEGSDDALPERQINDRSSSHHTHV